MLTRIGAADVEQTIDRARVPIIKFRYAHLPYDCDLSVSGAM